MFMLTFQHFWNVREYIRRKCPKKFLALSLLVIMTSFAFDLKKWLLEIK